LTVPFSVYCQKVQSFYPLESDGALTP
jgi:hypothetical protein